MRSATGSDSCQFVPLPSFISLLFLFRMAICNFATGRRRKEDFPCQWCRAVHLKVAAFSLGRRQKVLSLPKTGFYCHVYGCKAQMLSDLPCFFPSLLHHCEQPLSFRLGYFVHSPPGENWTTSTGGQLAASASGHTPPSFQPSPHSLSLSLSALKANLRAHETHTSMQPPLSTLSTSEHQPGESKKLRSKFPGTSYVASILYFNVVHDTSYSRESHLLCTYFPDFPSREDFPFPYAHIPSLSYFSIPSSSLPCLSGPSPSYGT